MAIKTDARQIRLRDTPSQLASVANKELDDLLRSADSELTMPLRLRQTMPSANLVLNIGNIFVTNPEHARKRIIPPISNTLPTFASGTVTLGATGAGSATPSTGVALALGMTSSQFLKLGIHLDGNGNIVLTKGLAGVSEAAATAAPVAGNTYAIGYIVVRTDGSNNVQTVTDTYIYQYIGGGTGSGSGDASSVRSRIEDQLSQSFYEYAAYNIASIDGDDKFNTGASTATYDLVDNVFDFAGAAADLVSIELLDTEFLTASKDLDDVEFALHYKTTQIDTAPTLFVSRAASDAEADFYPVTLTRVGQSEIWTGRKTWTDDFKYVTTTHDQGGNTTFTALSGTAGTEEALANIFNASVTLPQQYYPEFASFVLVRQGSWTLGQGSFRLALYEGSTNGAPSSLLHAGAWVDMSTVPGSDTVYTLTIPTKFLNRPVTANKFFYAVIETDSTYKTNVTATTKELRAKRDASALSSFRLDGTTWSSLATGTLAAQWGYHTDYQDLVVDGQFGNSGMADINASDAQWLATGFALAAPEPILAKVIRTRMDRDGSPAGYVYLQIIKDSTLVAGTPSLLATDIVAESTPIAVSAIPTSNNEVYFYFGDGVVLAPGITYHIVMKTSGYTWGASDNIGWATQTSGSLVPATKYNGTAWANYSGGAELAFDVYGREISSRLKVVSSMASGLNGYAMLYSREATAITPTQEFPRQRFDFYRSEDKTNFPITVFTAHPDFVKCHYVQAGQTFVTPAFTLSGNTAVFPSGTFSGIPTTELITLIFEQFDGGAADTSDVNANLLAENHLGSIYGVDRSSPGRGLYLRNANGLLREIALDEFDNIVVLSTP